MADIQGTNAFILTGVSWFLKITILLIGVNLASQGLSLCFWGEENVRELGVSRHMHAIISQELASPST